MDLQKVLEEVSADRISAHIEALVGVRHPEAAPVALGRAGDYIRDTLERLGYSMSEQRFNDNGSDFANVIATRSGTAFPQRRVIVLAHFDTVSTSPGADDNASGVAVLLEAARVLAPLQFERTLQFIGVNLEENASEHQGGTGTRGSGALAGFARREGWEIEGVLVLESVAYAGATVQQTAPAGIPAEVIPAAGDFIAVVGNEKSSGLVQGFGRAIERHGIALPVFPLVVPGNGELLPDTRRSDHAPFWDHGYLAVMLTDTTNFRNPHYHQPSDTLETLNLHFAAEVCRATAGFAVELARSGSL
jgi:hypothetical protein